MASSYIATRLYMPIINIIKQNNYRASIAAYISS